MRHIPSKLSGAVPPWLSSLRVKVPILAAAAALIMLCALALVSFRSAENILLDGIKARFLAIQQTRADDLAGWFAEQKHTLEIHAGDSLFQDALFEFDSIWSKDRSGTRAQLVEDYITANPHPPQEREKLNAGAGQKLYARAHSQYHPQLRKIMQREGLADIYLVNLDGDVVYSVTKGAGFAADLASGPLSDSGLGRAWNRAIKAKGTPVVFEDFVPFRPTGRQAGFFATKITGMGMTIGIVVLRVEPSALSEVLSKGRQPGDGVRTRLIGADARVRASSDGRVGGDISDMGAMVRRVLAGDSISFARHHGATGPARLVSMRPFSALAGNWALVTDIPVDRAMTPVTKLRGMLLWVVAAFGIGAVALGVVFSRILTAPILRLQQRVAALRDGDLDSDVPSRSRRDEIGRLAGDLEALRQKLARAAEQEREAAQQAQEVRRQERAAQQEAREQKRVVELLSATISRLEKGDLTARVEDEVPPRYEVLRSGLNAAISRLCDAMVSIAQSAGTIDVNARGIETSLDLVHDQAESQAGDLAGTAAALKHLTQSVSETADNTVSAERGMKAAIDEVHRSEDTVNEARRMMEEISASAERVLSVTSLIDSVAFQTNLLALNAGIEAARAGEAGKGFAVVATEVRALAERTAQAARDINSQLDSNSRVIMAATDTVTRLAELFTGMIADLGASCDSIAAITGAAQEQSLNIQQIDDALSRLDTAVQENTARMGDVHAAGVTMAGEAARLRGLAAEFQTVTTPFPDAAAPGATSDQRNVA